MTTFPASPHAMNETRGRFPMSVRWSDVDAFGHVNNGAFLRYLDDARFALFPVSGVDQFGEFQSAGLFVVRHEIEYLTPLTYRTEHISVEVWTINIGNTSVDFGYEIVSRPPNGNTAIYARARSRMVLIEQGTGAPRPFTAVERAQLARYQDSQPIFRGW